MKRFGGVSNSECLVGSSDAELPPNQRHHKIKGKSDNFTFNHGKWREKRKI